MTTPETSDPIPVDPVHAGPETPSEPPLAGTACDSRNLRTWSAAPDELSPLQDPSASRGHATVTAVLGDVGEDRPPGQRPVAGDSVVWNA